MSPKPTSIYALIDPSSGEIRYVGKTVMPVAQRLREHVFAARRGAKTHCAAWLRGLNSAGIHPKIRVIEVVEPDQDWTTRERFWIAHYRAKYGRKLTNISPGGDGLSIPRTPEWIEKIARAQRGKKRPPLTAEHREKIRSANIGRSCPKSQAHREKLRIANLGRKNGPPSAETRAKISAAERGKKQPPLTAAQYGRLMAAVGRGETHHAAKLTSNDVLAIRRESSGGKALAAKFGVDYSTIKLVRARKIWRHV